MTDTPKGSDPAFPVPGHHYAKGEDVRVDIAKHIMAALAGASAYGGWSWSGIANHAVQATDALIAALDKH